MLHTLLLYTLFFESYSHIFYHCVRSIGGSGGPSIGTGTGGSPHKDLEALLSQQLRGQLGSDQSKRSAEDLETQQRRVRASISREYARPVEVIIKVYEDAKTDLYDVLAINRTADELTITRAYRSAALSVHPDKNPHPDAKIAFDALQDAFGTLASPLKRFVRSFIHYSNPDMSHNVTGGKIWLP